MGQQHHAAEPINMAVPSDVTTTGHCHAHPAIPVLLKAIQVGERWRPGRCAGAGCELEHVPSHPALNLEHCSFKQALNLQYHA